MDTTSAVPEQRPLSLLGQRMALVGLVIYVIFAPHSVAASAIGVALAGVGWLIRTIATGSLGVRRSKFDLIILLSLLWTIASSLLSAEPQISLIKLRSSWCVFLFYLTRAIVTRRQVVPLVALLILSGCAGTMYSVYDLVRGRGVVVESLTEESPFRQLEIRPGDTVWRVAGQRVYSVQDIDRVISFCPYNTPLSVSVISQGEHIEPVGLTLRPEIRDSGIIGSTRSHRFRASGWTRHYETFAELLQMITQLALGLALANFRNHGPNRYFNVAAVAACWLTLGIAFTAMRTLLIAVAVGASLMAWLSLKGIPKLVFTALLFFLLAFGAVVVSQTRARNALLLSDPSSSLRGQVARVGLSRLMLHPVFGHGMDAVKLHWNEWGFPGKDMLHLHSTPLQLVFDRGFPMLFLWLWMMGAFWLQLARGQQHASDMSDTNSYGVLLGTLGALTGFLASSLVNYNYGDGEAAMMFWWLMGIALVLSERRTIELGHQ